MKQLIVLFTFQILISTVQWACTGGTNAGTLTPGASYQTQAVSNGQYYVVNVTCGSTYNFTFCSDGGSAAWDTQITINQSDNTTQLAYNDDNCGLQSSVSWTATFTGTIHVLISRYSCNHDGGSAGTLAYNVTSTSVIYSASCTTANPIISGATGGTFAFSPVPGDGATINSSTGGISNGTEGASYNVTYTYCGGTINIPVTMGSSPCYELNGNAQYIDVAGEQCIQLTAEANSQTGCAWSDEQIDFNSDFSLSLDYYFGDNPNGADGSTFTFQPNPGACGAEGAQLGAGGIPNALIVEFDTYDNDGGTGDDLSCDHIAVETDGDLPDDPSTFPANDAPYCGPTCAHPLGNSIENGATHEVEIQWDATLQTLTVYFDGLARLTCSGDFINSVFGGDNIVYWGATAATGGLNNQQYFCPQTVVILPAELLKFESSCDREKEKLYWTTASEANTSIFQPEYTTDGFIFHPLGHVAAAGNSQEIREYSLELPADLPDNRYYRLKTIDMDGNITTTNMIAANICEKELIRNLSYEEGLLSVEFNSSNVDFDIYDLSGRHVMNSEAQNKSKVDIYLAKGTYVLYARSNGNQLSETRKFNLF